MDDNTNVELPASWSLRVMIILPIGDHFKLNVKALTAFNDFFGGSGQIAYVKSMQSGNQPSILGHANLHSRYASSFCVQLA